MNKDILFTEDYSPFDNYDKYCLTQYGTKYSDLIKREQKFLKNLILRKYKKSVITDSTVILVYIHADFGKRQDRDYKLVERHSIDYEKWRGTDDYNEVGIIKDFVKFFNLEIN